MKRLRHLLSLVLAAALIAGQWAGQLHALSHAEYDLAIAGQAQTGGDSPAPLDHARDRCVAFHAVDCALSAPPLAFVGTDPAVTLVIQPGLPLRAAKHTAYSSRAPPVLHVS